MHSIQELHSTFRAGTTRKLSWRRAQLKGLLEFIDDCNDEIREALQADLGKPAMEVKVSETGYVKAEAKHALKNLRRWTTPDRLHTPLFLRPGKARIVYEPYGVALILGPWNYPVQLALAPLAAALAAGNCVVLKPSEIAPATSALLARCLPEYLDPRGVAVMEGDAETAKALLAERFDYIFYTGSTNIGRKVMTAAAKNLTPVTLELGGKCPCIVDERTDLNTAARRIVWGKYLNAGQTCVAPDYILVKDTVKTELLDRMVRTITEFYGQEPQQSLDYGRIVNDRHFDRLHAVLADGEIVCGGEYAREEHFISPTIVHHVPADSALLQDEIFGPILPVIEFSELDQAVEFVNARPKPLALYLFSEDRVTQTMVLQRTSSGGVCLNDTILHLSSPHFPFGGVGASGMGRYHGRAGFETFSNAKTILHRRTWFDPKLRYPPYK